MRLFLLLATLVFVASPLEAQKRAKRDPYKISQEELAEYGEASMVEVIPRARPNFLTFGGAGGAGVGSEQSIRGMMPTIVVFVGTQQQGDSSTLRFYKANEVKEVRYFKPGNSLSPLTAGNAYVIQLVMRDRRDP